MNPFPVQHNDDGWCVITGDGPVACASQADAELLAQIPCQHSRIHADAALPPDRQVIESIIKLGETYGLDKRMAAFRRLKTGLAKRAA